MKQRFVFQFFIAIALFVAATGCVALKEYKKAQNAFNLGASLEMKQRTASSANDLPASPDLEILFPTTGQPDMSLKPASYYQNAYDQVTKALKVSGKLKSSDVLGEALAIKALAAWKLKKYEEAREAAKVAGAELEIEPDAGARDKALMAAMGGLIAIDLAHDSISKMNKILLDAAQKPENVTKEQATALYEQAKMHFEQFVFSRQISRNSLWQGIQTIDEAKMKAEPTHDIQRYLLMAQLSGLKNWTDALNAIDTAAKRLGVKSSNNAAKGWIEDQKSFYRTTRDGYLGKLAGLIPGGKNAPVYLSWEKIL
ncbi:MAG: hypothetical protein SH848_18685 [Saprospiraceae bacterium]|mgnify:CR=1 FL=1|nr:hypothetical protein [Saprospiraceae bacterium]MDZ4705960.1 hypothetical protein [Saprospiraceae bacterium]